MPTLITGTVGAFIGGFIAKLLGLTAYNVIGEVVVATIGATHSPLHLAAHPGDLNRSLCRHSRLILRVQPGKSSRAPLVKALQLDPNAGRPNGK